MDERTRRGRILRLLEARLEALACASERGPRGELRLELEIAAAVAATKHAIDLELISAREASAVWTRVARRHPDAAWCQGGPRLAA